MAGPRARLPGAAGARDGRGRAFSRVYWVGHSLGTLYAWVEAAMVQDVDAFVLTGLLHTVKPSWLQEGTSSIYPAVQDLKFAASGLDDGYLTTRPWTRVSWCTARPWPSKRRIRYSPSKISPIKAPAD